MTRRLHLCSGVAIGLVMGLVAGGAIAPQTWASDLPTQLDIRPHQNRAGQVRDVADQLLRLGIQHRDAGRYSQAIQAWNQAIEIYNEIGDLAAIGIAHDYIGLTYGRLGQYREAEDALRRRLSVARDNEDLQGETLGWNNVGTILLQSGNLTAAETSFREGLRVSQSVGHDQGVGLSLSNIALVASARGDIDEAIKLYDAAIDFRYRGNDRAGAANSFNSLAALYQRQGRLPEALRSYNAARRIAQESRNTQVQFRALDQMIAIYQEQGRVDLLRPLLTERIELSNQTGDPGQQLIAFQLLGEFYELTEDLTSARAAYSQARTLASRLEDGRTAAFLQDRINRIDRLGLN